MATVLVMTVSLMIHRGLFEGPRFDVPVLGLGEPTLDMAYFGLAVAAGGAGELDEALVLWRHCLEAGALEAHYGLGYTLLDLGRPREAYRHLRYYSELTPANPWAWCYRGRAAEALGEIDEARGCYARAIELEDGDLETDADERLDAIGPGGR